MMEFLTDYVLPVAGTAVSLTLTIAIPIAVQAMFKFLAQRGIVVEEARQRMFQTGLENAASDVLRRAGGGKITQHMLYQHGVRYVENAVPDQLRHFDLDEVDVASKIQGKLAARGVFIEKNEFAPKPETGPRRVAGRAFVQPTND